jgi:hypothetical protein
VVVTAYAKSVEGSRSTPGLIDTPDCCEVRAETAQQKNQKVIRTVPEFTSAPLSILRAINRLLKREPVPRWTYPY